MGSGAFASVWLGYDENLDSQVAIKVLADNWARHADVRDRFLAEARILRKADSDRVLRVLDIGELDDGRPFFVTNYADRGSLEDRLAKGELSMGEAIRIVTNVAEAVCVLHEIDVIHRDLKPSNVLFRSGPSGEQVVLADLGLAKAIAASSGLTVMAGSPGYMAPEQSRPGGEIDVRTDIYGLGALAYRLLTGVTWRSRGGARVPARIERVVLRALHSDRNRRWPTMRVFADRLHALSAKTWLRRPRLRMPRLPRARYLIAGALVLVVLSAGAWKWGPDFWGNDNNRKPDGSNSQVAPEDACQPSQVSLMLNDPGSGADPTDTGSSLFISVKDPVIGGAECTLRGHLTNVRFLDTSGGEFPVRVKEDDFKPPVDIPVKSGWVGEIDLRWKGENVQGSHVLPAAIEFRLPGSSEPIKLDWNGGYINIGYPAYHSAAFPSGN